MTAHVFVPALDEERPATLSKRIVTEHPARGAELSTGVILSDDLEMKAIASEYAVPSAAVLAIEAGCDGVLICSGDHDTQAASLEALVHAVEDGRIPLNARSTTRWRASSGRRSGFSPRRWRRGRAGARRCASVGRLR